jgi:hypothetical protein
MSKPKVGDKVWCLHPQSGRTMAGVILCVKVFGDISNSTRVMIDYPTHREWCAIELIEIMNDSQINESKSINSE